MSQKDEADQVAGAVNFAILHHIAKWLSEHHLEDLTQVDDEYILRQMVRLDCFSISDVIKKRDALAEKYNISR